MTESPLHDVRIVNLDGYTANPGDNSWAPFEALGSYEVFDRGGERALLAAQSAHALLTNKICIDGEMLARCPELRYVGVLATGTNVVDVQACTAKNVVVTNVPGYSTASVAQHAMALLLELANQVGAHDRAVQSGDWGTCPDYSFCLAQLHELAGKNLGIVGMGAIGQAFAAIGSAFGMTVLAAARSRRPEIPGVSVSWLPIEELFEQADVLSLHCPLTDATKHLVNHASLRRMKPSAMLINVSRGGLVDEVALARALTEGRIAGAGLDVLAEEPPRGGSPLIGAPRCVITPHIAWATLASRQRVVQIGAGNLKAFLQGNPQNVVNAPK